MYHLTYNFHKKSNQPETQLSFFRFYSRSTLCFYNDTHSYIRNIDCRIEKVNLVFM